MGGVGEALEVEAHALVEHLVFGEQRGKIGEFGGSGKLAVDDQVGGLDEGAFFREFGDVVASIAKNAFFTIDEGDGAFAGAGIAVAGVESDVAGFAAEG